MQRLSIIGSGPSALYLLQNLCRCKLDGFLNNITVFERGDELGVGMPYSRATTDRFNICNISSEEIPRLDVSFVDWLQSLDKATRSTFGVVDESISPKETYPRIALGGYFSSQWIAACEQLRSRGIEVIESPLQPIADIIDDCEKDLVYLVNDRGDRFEFEYVVVATGHRWNEKDRPKEGFYASPWPIQKLLPEAGGSFSYTIGTLGASLSAFDVITSLAHRHGQFVSEGDDMRFEPHPCADEFKIVMHSANGWLPHLQYEQREPFRDIYRHVSEDHQSIVQVDRNGEQTLHRYKMFVDCSGQQVLDIDEYPFVSLVESGSVRAARVRFANSLAVAELDDKTRDRLIDQRGGAAIRLDGIDIDESFRVIGVDGEPNPRIYEMSFPHTAGKRPYSYGLQACNDTARIVVASLLNANPETGRCKEAE